MIRKTLGLVVLAVTGGLALACSSSGDPEKYPNADAFCSAKADEECNGLYAQCAATLDSCKTKRVSACQNAAGGAAGQGRTYTASLAQGCIDKTHELFAGKTVAPDKETEQVDTCERVFAGSKQKNAPCGGTYECSGSLVCDKGVCAEKVVRNQSEPCNNPGEVCAAGSYCGAQGQLKFCMAKNAKGDVCTADAPCVEDLRCIGTCTDKYQPGQVCGTTDECSSAAPYCDPLQKRCLVKYQAGTQACKDFGGS